MIQNRYHERLVVMASPRLKLAHCASNSFVPSGNAMPQNGSLKPLARSFSTAELAVKIQRLRAIKPNIAAVVESLLNAYCPDD